MVGPDFENSIRRLRAICFEQLTGLSAQLIDVGVLAHYARGWVSPADGHDELLSRPCSAPGLCARCPLSRAGKEIILDDETTDVGVDAVLSADVGDAPMRRRQYTARVDARRPIP
jgi:hypothetical protein